MSGTGKFKISWHRVGVALAVIVSLWTMPNSIESRAPIRPEPVTKKVIVSPHLGEVTKDSRYSGEKVKFKIYFHQKETKPADITIIDTLDAHLAKSNVFNNGTYDAATHKITWQISKFPANQQGFVEFEATAGPAGTIATNQAEIHFGPLGTRPVKTNAVEIRVLAPPKLGWISFNGEDPAKTPPRSYMKDETTTGLMVNFDIPGMYVSDASRDGVTYHRLSIPGQATMLSEGKPDVPIMGQVVEVPYGVNLGIEVVKAQAITLANYHVYPAQLQEGAPSPPPARQFALDKPTYLKDAYFPEQPAFFTSEDVGVIRGHRLVFFKVNPLQYNPVTRELKAYKNIEIRITYDKPAQIRRVNRRVESAPFEKLLKRLLLNYKAPNRFGETGAHGMVAQTGKSDSFLSPFPRPAHAQARVEGCDYLILTHGTFYANPQDPNNRLNRLREWKQKKGLKVRIVDVATIPGGATAAAIRSYLQTAYDTWLPIPAYVLLVGDHQLLPTDQGAVTHWRGGKVPTDLPYAMVDGSDYFPDIFIGRLPVDTLAQLDGVHVPGTPDVPGVVDKILAYEQNPPANPNFYRGVSLISYFDDDIDLNGREEHPWIENVEDVRTFLRNNPYPYTVDRLYTCTLGSAPNSYLNGNPLPGGLTWNSGAADISNAINNGRFLITYRDHGGQTTWEHPLYGVADITGLTNTGLTPVIFSIACANGWFDDPAIQCFCEEFLRQDNQRGAVAIIGATRNTKTGWNDYLMFGLHKAIWPAYAPNPDWTTTDPSWPHPGIPVREGSPLFQMGPIHTFGKAFMANGYVASDIRQLEFEMYHLFGDPEMSIWTEEPATLRVDPPEGIGSTGTQDFIVKVTNTATGDPVENAVATLVFNGALVGSQSTNPDGLARFTGSYSAGTLDLTVTAHNYRPHLGTIKVSSGGAHINRLDPQDGPVNQTIHVGGQNFAGSENVDIYLGGSNVLTQAASAGSFGQAGGADVDMQIPATYPLGPVNIMAKGQTGPDNRYGVKVFQVRKENPVDLYLYSQFDASTWGLHPGDNPTWDNPDIQLYDTAGNPVASNNLVVGNQYTIKVKVHNDTNFDADKVKVNLKWADFGAGQPPSTAWTAILPTPEVDVPRTSTGEAEAQWVPPSTGHICLRAEIYHVEDINSANNLGQENCHIGPTSSPARVPFKIWNPTDQPAAMYLEVRQLTPYQPVWKTTVEHPDPQIVPPGGSTAGTVVIEPTKEVDCRQPADFALTGFINGQMVGGVNFRISCAPGGIPGIGVTTGWGVGPWKCCLLWGVFLAALLAVIVFLAAALSGVGWAWRALAAAGAVLLVAGLFLLYYCIPAAWRCCIFWLLFGFGLVVSLALLVSAHYARRATLWYALAIALAATALVGALLIVVCDASYLVVGGLLLALLLPALFCYRQFQVAAKTAQIEEGNE